MIQSGIFYLKLTYKLKKQINFETESKCLLCFQMNRVIESAKYEKVWAVNIMDKYYQIKCYFHLVHFCIKLLNTNKMIA